MNLYLHLKFFSMLSNYCLPQAKQSVTLLKGERCRIVLDIARTVSRLESQVTLQVIFWYFISFNMKSFSLKILKTNQPEAAPDMKVFTRHRF